MRARAVALELHQELLAVQRSLAEEPGLGEAPGAAGFVAGMLERYAELTRLDAELDAAQRACVLEHHRTLVQPVFLSVPLIRRSVDRPLGYPGDYLMVEAIFGGGRAADTAFGRLLQSAVLQCAPCRAHRYRAPWAHGWLERHAQDLRAPLRILSFACGPERILRAHAEQGARMQVTLCDHDPRALAHAEAALAPALGDRGAIESVELSAIRLIRGDRALLRERFARGFDAVLVLGLLDYLHDRLAGRLLRALAGLLRPGGLLLASNLDRDNRHRALMEYVGDWHALHRDRADLERLVASCGGLQTLELASDPDQANLLFAGRVQ